MSGTTQNNPVSEITGEAIEVHRLCFVDPATGGGKVMKMPSIIKPPQMVSTSAVASGERGTFDRLENGHTYFVESAGAVGKGKSIRAAAGGLAEEIATGFGGYIVGEAVTAASGANKIFLFRAFVRTSATSPNVTAG